MWKFGQFFISKRMGLVCTAAIFHFGGKENDVVSFMGKWAEKENKKRLLILSGNIAKYRDKGNNSIIFALFTHYLITLDVGWMNARFLSQSLFLNSLHCRRRPYHDTRWRKVLHHFDEWIMASALWTTCPSKFKLLLWSH